MISCPALEVPLEAKRAGDGGSGGAKILTQSMVFLNLGSTDVLSEMNVHHWADCQCISVV